MCHIAMHARRTEQKQFTQLNFCTMFALLWGLWARDAQCVIHHLENESCNHTQNLIQCASMRLHGHRTQPLRKRLKYVHKPRGARHSSQNLLDFTRRAQQYNAARRNTMIIKHYIHMNMMDICETIENEKTILSIVTNSDRDRYVKNYIIQQTICVRLTYQMTRVIYTFFNHTSYFSNVVPCCKTAWNNLCHAVKQHGTTAIILKLN